MCESFFINKNVKRTFSIALISASFLLFSCNVLDKAKSEDTSVSDSMGEKISDVAKDPDFLNKLHLIRNPKTNTEMIVKGDGTIVLKTMEPMIEQIGIIEDVSENTSNYVYKIYNGENLENKTYTYEDGSQFESKELSMRTVFYDKNGKEIGLVTNTYGANYTTKNMIIYRDNSDTSDENYLFAYDVMTKETTKLPYQNLYTYNGNFLMSTDAYDESIENEFIIVCDEDFREIKRIEGYSLEGVDKRKGVYLANVSKWVKGNNGESVKKYNYLDENYNFIFDEDIDERIWIETFPILTVRKGDIAFDYDFSKRKRVSEDRPYVKEENKWEIIQAERDKYEENRLKLQIENDKYEYVSVFTYGEDVLYMAYNKMGTGMFEDNACDIFNENLEKVATFDSVDNQYNEEGYLFVNKDTIYNTKLEVVKKFNEKCQLNRMEKFGRIFFANSVSADYSSKKDFELYDVNFNTLYEHLSVVETNTYDDYILLADKDNTMLLDKDANLKTIFEGRCIDIKSWYDDDNIGYKVFVDIKNDRMGIVDDKFNITVDNLKVIESLKEKYFTFQNGFKYGLMDYDGNPILTYSIFDTMMEDSVRKDFDGNFVYEYEEY